MPNDIYGHNLLPPTPAQEFGRAFTYTFGALAAASLVLGVSYGVGFHQEGPTVVYEDVAGTPLSESVVTICGRIGVTQIDADETIFRSTVLHEGKPVNRTN